MRSETVAMDGRPADCGRLASDGFVITCEHRGNRIPGSYRDLFHADQALRDSRRGFNPGAQIMQERWRWPWQRRWRPPPQAVCSLT